MFLLRFTDNWDNGKFGTKSPTQGEFYKQGYGGIEGKKFPHQAWQTGTKDKAIKSLNDLTSRCLPLEIVEYIEFRGV